jgi:DNA mismatch endonuclease, patch repair protein
MRHVRVRDTAPERVVRSALHSMGYRFRIEGRNLPGKPDIVLPRYRTVVFVHGCFWHGHQGCSRASRPTTNIDFWNAKLDRNIERDVEVRRSLEALGWHVVVIWQCETRNRDALEQRLKTQLPAPRSRH